MKLLDKPFKLLLLSLCMLIVHNAPPTITYPIRYGYINSVVDWGSSLGVARSFGIPGYSPPHVYNYICLTFWMISQGPVDAALAWNESSTYLSSFGSTSQEIRANIKKIYNDNGILLMVSAFGATERPTTDGYNANTCAIKLADFVIHNNLDGVDIDWQDTEMFRGANAGKGEAWLIELTTVLRSLLPNHIITHAPQAPYFVGTTHYPKNAYIQIDKKVGSMIQFYNVQFYNQDSTSYNTARLLFNVSGGWAPTTSVNQIIKKGINPNKLVVGKPTIAAQADTGGYMTAANIAKALLANYKFNGWKAGVMFWQYSTDKNGIICNSSINPLMNLVVPVTNVDVTWRPPKLVRMVYISDIANQVGANNIAKSLGVPTYDRSNIYNIICLGFWTVKSGPINAAKIWANPVASFGTTSVFGATNSKIQQSLKKLYVSKNIKLLIGVFGQIDLPSSFNYDPVVTAKNLATFVATNNLDGIDVNWNDVSSFISGKAQKWLVDFTQAFRLNSPNSIITHSPKASFFSDSLSSYPFGGYNYIHKQVGSLISFYNIIYYGTTSSDSYNTVQKVFNISGNLNPRTSVSELIAKAIPSYKIVVGKPSAKFGEFGSMITSANLGTALLNQYNFNRWCGGFIFWQLSTDQNGTFAKDATKTFKAAYPKLF